MSPTKLAVVCAAVLLCGCTTDRPLPDSHQSTTLIAYLQAMRRETSTLLDTVVAQTTSPTTETAEYWAWGDHWCPRHVDVHSTDDVVRKVTEYCAMKGGTFVEPYCRAAGTMDTALFYASFRRGIDLCQGVAATVAVEVVEPRPGAERSANYLDKLRTFGFQSGTDRAVAEELERQQLRKERERVMLEMPLLRTRGTRVCKRDGGLLFSGFVEEYSGTKIRINVNAAYYVSGGRADMRNPNYRPESIWDLPEHWFVCE